jgi:type II secretory pathway pseudopilin PulG
MNTVSFVSSGRRIEQNDGFSLVETLLSVAILMVVSSVVMKGVLGLTDIDRMVTNRTDMHNSVRNATELLTQEVGQAGRISLPAPVTLTAAASLFGTSLTVSSTNDVFVGEQLVIDTGEKEETVTVSAVPSSTTLTVSALTVDHAVNTPVKVLGAFATGVVPPAAGGFADGSTDSVLKIYGDIHGDGSMVYVEYTCDLNAGVLYRNSMPFDASSKSDPTIEQILIDKIEVNPADADGDVAPCFSYQTKVVSGTTYVVDVAITLTVRTEDKDRNTNDYQRETKALLNVSPRNVFNVWQVASLGVSDRIQPMPQSVANLLPEN